MNIRFEWIRRTTIISFLLIMLLTASVFISFPFQIYITSVLALLLAGTGVYHLIETNRIQKLLFRTSDILTRSTERDFSSLDDGEKHIINHEISNLIEQLEDSVKQTENILSEKDKLEKEAEELRRKVKSMERNLNRQVIEVRDRMRGNSDAFNEIISGLSSLIDACGREKGMIDSLMKTYSGYSRQYGSIRDSVNNSRSICGREESRGRDAETVLNALYEKDEERVEKIHRVMHGIGNIKEVTGIINEVAEKASILSLNAAIESAHAGEAGKGFSVVAEEVGVLADMTAEHAEIINQALFSVTDTMYESRFTETDDGEEETFAVIGGTIREMIASFREIDQLLDFPGQLEQPEDFDISSETLKDRNKIEKTLSLLENMKKEWEMTLEDITRFPLFEESGDLSGAKSSPLTRHETAIRPVDDSVGGEELD